MSTSRAWPLLAVRARLALGTELSVQFPRRLTRVAASASAQPVSTSVATPKA